MIESTEFFTKLYNVAILAGACDIKARYFANKQTLKKTGINLIEELGMTKRSKPTKDEILFVIREKDITATDLIVEYPFIRLTDTELGTILDELIADNLIKVENGFYTVIT